MSSSARSRSAFLLVCFAVGAGCSDTNDDTIIEMSPSTGTDGGGWSDLDGGGGVSLDSSMGTLMDATLTPTPGDASVSPLISFFVSSETSATGNLGGLAGADARCQRLAAAVGAGAKSWRAYLSVAQNPEVGGLPTHARDRIGSGPWYNAQGVLLASDLASLLARKGDPAVFLDEHGNRINGQWNAPGPNEHDVLTGSDADGRVVVGETCLDWTSSAATDVARVGHSDGLGPEKNGAPPYDSWNSSHASGGCHDTSVRGGAGRIYCFAKD